MYHVKIATRPPYPVAPDSKQPNPIEVESWEAGHCDNIRVIPCHWFEIHEIIINSKARMRLCLYGERPNMHGGNSAFGRYELNPLTTEVYVMNEEGRTIESFLWRRELERIIG